VVYCLFSTRPGSPNENFYFMSLSNNNLLKKVFFLTLLVMPAIAFSQSRFEMSLRGGASMLMYQSEYGKMMPSYNLGVDFYYTYLSQKYVGFRTGVACDVSQSKFHMSDYNDYYSCIDYTPVSGMAGVGGDKMNVRYSIRDVMESHNQIYLSVPVQLAITAGNFAMFVGPKFAFPMYAAYKQDLSGVKVSVEYPDYGVVVDGDNKVYNSNLEKSSYFSYKDNIAHATSLNKMQNLNIMLSADINYYIPMSKKSGIGLGLYVDYGLPLYPKNAVWELQKGEKTWRHGLLYIDDPTSSASATMYRAHNSVLDAVLVQGSDVPSSVSHLITGINYLSCGIRLSYYIGGEKKERFKSFHKPTGRCNCVFNEMPSGQRTGKKSSKPAGKVVE